MKHFLNYSACIFIVVLMLSCGQKRVTQAEDYAAWLHPATENTQLKFIDTELSFWSNRLANAPSGDLIAESKVAGLLVARFSYSGNVEEVHEADSIYKVVNQLRHTTSSGTFRALATNCITQHQFQQAQLYIDSALALGDDKYLTTLIEFDVSLELGNYTRARRALNSLPAKNKFDYLIRAAKYKDHVEGDLDAAIELMEKAYDDIKHDAAGALYLWTKSNLGDMYGHANRYKESYQCYLDVLEKDPYYFHALKGIAWLAFSHDKDAHAAKQILYYLQQQYPVPDYDLMLAEIADYEKDATARQQHLEKFVTTVQNEKYGGMYNKYLFALETDVFENPVKALHIAEREVSNRPTPEAFSWLARAYCENGNTQKAMETARLYVENKCYEPDALYNLGVVYKTGGNKKAARKYLSQAKASAYELGPVTAEAIQKLLATL